MTAPATSAIDAAVAAVQAHFDQATVTTVPDGTGGVYVLIDQVDVGPAYTPSTTWLGFQLSAAYPDADVYPHYTGPLIRTDGQAHCDAIQQTTWQGRPDQPAQQISRRSNHWNPAVDTAANKAARILAWLAAR
ncbi:E2/UBC family protein [Streptomyces sp. NPDC048663]|uniref:E2/UBC family protein n=1 Tax=Streptomyces sp. NPDC048663 TaxID=3155638 RepID=UPI00342628C8